MRFGVTLTRLGWLFGIVLAGYAAPTAASAGVVPDLAAGPGCLGVPAQTCIDWLRATMALDEGAIADEWRSATRPTSTASRSAAV